MRWLTALIATLAIVVTGCGDEDRDEPSDAGPNSNKERRVSPTAPRPDEPPTDSGDFTGQAAENYDIAKVACAAFPPRKVAIDLGLAINGDTAEELGQIAERYARGYTGPNRQAAFEGCLDGLPNPP